MDATEIGKRIKSVRESANKTQVEFCNLINCTQAALSGYENGSKIPSIDTLYTIAKKCQVSLDWLCGIINQNDNRFSINTSADIFIIINELLKNKHIKLEKLTRTDTYIAEHGFPEEYDFEDLVLCFDDKILKPYIEKLEKMQELLNNETIDIELYELWLNKTINELNDKILFQDIFDEL